MSNDERQFLLTAVWMFMRHGQPSRALNICAAVALAELLLDEGEAARAIEVLRAADISQDLLHAEAVLETRALRQVGREGEASARWRRYLEARKGAARQWVS